MHNERVQEMFLVDDPARRPPVIYPPVDSQSQNDTLTVRSFWDEGERVPRDRGRFVSAPNGVPKLHLDTAFEPGRYYR